MMQRVPHNASATLQVGPRGATLGTAVPAFRLALALHWAPSVSRRLDTGVALGTQCQLQASTLANGVLVKSHSDPPLHTKFMLKLLPAHSESLSAAIFSLISLTRPFSCDIYRFPDSNLTYDGRYGKALEHWGAGVPCVLRHWRCTGH